jgi:hypothetical protein
VISGARTNDNFGERTLDTSDACYVAFGSSVGIEFASSKRDPTSETAMVQALSSVIPRKPICPALSFTTALPVTVPLCLLFSIIAQLVIE